MDVKEITGWKQGSDRKISELDDRYGKIGISAVAAAVHHRSERRVQQEPRRISYKVLCESD